MGWKPIATAPKDQTQEEMLLGFGPVGIKIMRYSGWGDGTGPFQYLFVGDDGYAFWRDFPATHWMPLPTPPESDMRAA